MKKSVISASTLLAIVAVVVAVIAIKMPDAGNSTNDAASNAVSNSAVEVANVTNKTYHKVTKASDVTSNKTTNPDSNISTMPARGEVTIQVPSTTATSTNKVTYANNSASAIVTRSNTTTSTTQRATTTTTKRATTTQRVTTTQKATTTKSAATTAPQRTVSLVDAVPETTKKGGNTGRVVGYENDMLRTLNSYRAQVGVAPVQMTETLNNLASVRAKELSVYYNDKHIRPNGTEWYTVLDNNGVNFVHAGENIAYGQPTSGEMMTAWYNSKGHRDNMQNSKYKYVGFGCYSNNGTKYWVQIFIG